ncbi:MAG TPA: TonB-dependent receptor [Vicinamibacterales bacterium]|nr:TonB-dependent receptor [Vicinamibacterales bacterium]
MKFRAALLLGALLLATNADMGFGQGFQGGLRGSIKDAGGVIPGVEVTLTNEQTNIKRSVVTNERGEFVFANVDPGTYGVKATLQGYKSIDRGGIRIGTQQFLTLDLTMEVGAITENVTVTGEAPLIDTSNASTGTVLDTSALQTLPAPGRNAFMIGASVPTVVPSGDAQFNRQQDQTNASLMSLGGGTRRGNNYTLDGVPITDLRNRMSAVPTIEGVEDLKVQVHTYDAEMGRTGGGVFNVTARSGTNSIHGTGFFQTRPIWGQTNNYFSQITSDTAAARGDTKTAAANAKPNSPYYLGGGGIGGPIVKDRTFFFFSTESYHDVQTRNSSIRMPTQAERNGDFSGLRNTAGNPVTIYDPLTHLPFPGNVIPASRINPVAAKMIGYLPLPDTNLDNGTANYNRTSLINNKFEQEYAGKVEHKFTDKVSLTGFYLYNRTDEPCQNYFGTADQTEPNRFADPLDYLLKRRPQVLALNNTWVLSDSSVLALRFGKTDFPDNNTVTAAFDPATLGFSQNYLALLNPDFKKFPQVRLSNYDALATRTLGAINPTQIDWKSTSANAAYSRFFGTHTMKFGGDFRKIGMDSFLPGDSNGYFYFDNEFTSANGQNNSDAVSGNSVASFLLGYPTANAGNLSQFSVSTPLNIYTYYFGGYAQDDWRVNSKFTLNYGIRLERETGLAEQNNNFTVGFDRNATSALSSVVIPADPIAGTPARNVTGGLMYAGVNGAPTTQGNPPRVKASPRVGAVYSMDTNTVVRAGYGIYWAPYNYPAPSTSLSNYGQVGYTQNTVLTQTPINPTVTLDNPYPNGVLQPSGNSRGPLTGVGTFAAYIDQNRSAPRVQQWSADVQRELGGGQAVSFTYMGAKGDHLPLGGSVDVAVNINQLDPKYLALGQATLTQQLPNPFLGNPNVPASLSTPTTLPRWRLLTPFPQFTQVNDYEVTEGRNLYNAAVVEWSKRVSHGWGGRVSYTYSVLKDNQFAETNFYTAVGPGLPINNYNYVSSAPVCQAGQQFTTACYDPNAEYGYGILDVPHRVIIAPIAELPFGKGKKWASDNGVADAIIGGWTVSALINIQAGFPLNVQQSNPNAAVMNGGVAARPNINGGVDLATPGSFEDRLASADHPAATWINPAAFSLVTFGQFGNTPRTITDLRTPGQANVDASFIKGFRLGGSKSAQIKIEMLNLFNRPNVRALQGNNTFAPGNSFGQTNLQSGFMRITQLMFRFNF